MAKTKSHEVTKTQRVINNMALFEVELASQWLRLQLQKPVSNNFKLLSVCRFFSLFIDKEDQSKYTSYYLQFKEDIFSLIMNSEFQYCSPEEVDEINGMNLGASPEPYSAAERRGI